MTRLLLTDSDAADARDESYDRVAAVAEFTFDSFSTRLNGLFLDRERHFGLEPSLAVCRTYSAS